MLLLLKQESCHSAVGMAALWNFATLFWGFFLLPFILLSFCYCFLVNVVGKVTVLTEMEVEQRAFFIAQVSGNEEETSGCFLGSAGFYTFTVKSRITVSWP